MFVSANSNDLQRIVILNPKGGCGKTTLATNLASYFAIRGPLPALLDCDAQLAKAGAAGNTPYDHRHAGRA